MAWFPPTGFGSPSIRDQSLSLGADAYVE